MDDLSGHMDWHWGHWTFDYSVSDSEGLSLFNGWYRGLEIFYKFSLPVIRVKYLHDAGWHTWAGKYSGAGPYSDQITRQIDTGDDHGLQIWTGTTKYVDLSQFRSGGVRWLAMSVYARIGAYHIVQAWHLSELGEILPRVWSKGLHRIMDHTHHPYWRLDFDIDGAPHNIVSSVDDVNGEFSYYTEANDFKNSAIHRHWHVWNTQTGRGVFIYPGEHDGIADAFSSIDVAVRRYHPEETNPWLSFGAWGELGFLDGEFVGDSDIVFWYIAHLFHHAAEGDDAWHGAGPTIKVDLARLPPIPPPLLGLTITASTSPDQSGRGGDLMLNGRGFTPSERVQILVENIPGDFYSAADEVRANPDGTLNWIKRFDCTSNTPADRFQRVIVSALDVRTENVATTTTRDSTIWVCPPLNPHIPPDDSDSQRNPSPV